MPRIVPSDVVNTIKRAYPSVDEFAWSPGLDGTHAPTIAAILRLVEEIPLEFTALLPPPEYRDYLLAIEAVRHHVGAWGSGDENACRNLLTRFDRFPDLPHPLAVLHATFAGLPDQAPAIASSVLAFIREDDLRASLRQDVSTAYSTLANNEFKAAAVMAGSVVEALLLWALKAVAGADLESAKRKLRVAKPKLQIPGDMLEWHLPHFAGVAHHAGVVDEGTYEALQLLQQFRNLIHPGRQERLREEPSRANALLALGAMQRTIDAVAAWTA